MVVVAGAVVVVTGDVVAGEESTVDVVGVELVVVVRSGTDVVLAGVVLLGLTGAPTPAADSVRTVQPAAVSIEAAASKIARFRCRATGTVCQPIGRPTGRRRDSMTG
jgi:hypothetical protein